MAAGAESDLLATVDLVTRARQGDRPAAEQLFRRYRAHLEAFVYSRVPLRARRLVDTQDIVQDVCIKILVALDRFEARGVGSFWCFARTIASNHLIDCSRRGGALHETTLRDGSGSCPPAFVPDPSKQAEAREWAEDFDRELAKLPERLRIAILARLELKLEWNVIAEECDYPSPDAARVAVKRALGEIAKRMSGHDGTA